MLLRRVVTVFTIGIPALLRAQNPARSESLLVVSVGGQPVPFASVSIKGGTGRVTNPDGVLMIVGQDDTLSMLVRRMGFEPFQGRIGRAPGRAFRVTLAPTAQSLKKFVVNERATPSPLERTGFYDRMLEVQRGAPTGEFFTPEDLDARAGGKLSQFLYASRFAKVMMSTGTAGRVQRARAALMGRNNCAMALLIDGIVIHNVLGDSKETPTNPKDPQWGTFGEQRTSIDDLVNAQEVMAVEVYPSIANAPMSIASRVMGSACGIVAVWTGSRR